MTLMDREDDLDDLNDNLRTAVTTTKEVAKCSTLKENQNQRFSRPREREQSRVLLFRAADALFQVYTRLAVAGLYQCADAQVSSWELARPEFDLLGVLFGANAIARLFFDDDALSECFSASAKDATDATLSLLALHGDMRCHLAAALSVSHKLCCDADVEYLILSRVLQCFYDFDDQIASRADVSRSMRAESHILKKINTHRAVCDSLHHAFSSEIYKAAQMPKLLRDSRSRELATCCGYAFYHSSLAHKECDVVETLANEFTHWEIGRGIACAAIAAVLSADTAEAGTGPRAISHYHPLTLRLACAFHALALQLEEDMPHCWARMQGVATATRSILCAANLTRSLKVLTDTLDATRARHVTDGSLREI